MYVETWLCVWLCFILSLMSAQTNAKQDSFDASPCTAHRLAHGDLPYVHMMGKSSDQITATSRRTHAHNMTHTHTHTAHDAHLGILHQSPRPPHFFMGRHSLPMQRPRRATSLTTTSAAGSGSSAGSW